MSPFLTFLLLILEHAAHHYRSGVASIVAKVPVPSCSKHLEILLIMLVLTDLFSGICAKLFIAVSKDILARRRNEYSSSRLSCLEEMTIKIYLIRIGRTFECIWQTRWEFQPHVRPSPPSGEVQNTSPIGPTLMRDSRLRAKEAEENRAWNNVLDEKTSLEDRDTHALRPKYPDHPGLHAPGDFKTLAGHHRLASSIRGSNPDSTQLTYLAGPGPSPCSNTSFYSNVNPSSSLGPHPRVSPGFHAPSLQGTYSGALEYMSQEYSGLGPYDTHSNRNSIQPDVQCRFQPRECSGNIL